MRLLRKVVHCACSTCVKPRLSVLFGSIIVPPHEVGSLRSAASSICPMNHSSPGSQGSVGDKISRCTLAAPQTKQPRRVTRRGDAPETQKAAPRKSTPLTQPPHPDTCQTHCTT